MMIDTNDIICVDQETIGTSFLIVLEKFFEDRKNQTEYKKWLKTRSKAEITQWYGLAS